MNEVKGAFSADVVGWAMAENSFRLAGDGDKTDSASAFNLSLALLNERRTVGDNKWLREAFKRNTDRAGEGQIWARTL